MNMNDPYRNSPRAPLAGVPLGSSTKSKKSKKSKKVKSGETKVFRIMTVLLAGVAVITLYTLSFGKEGNYVYVVVATDNITSRIEVKNSNYTTKKVEVASLEIDTFSAATSEQALAALEPLGSMLYSHPVYEGQQIRKTMLTDVDNLKPNERLVAVRAQAVRAVAATVKSGDKVDIYVSDTSGLTILLGQGIEVVAVTLEASQLDSIAAEQLTNPDVKLTDYAATNPIGGTYILRVPVGDVAKYIASDIGGVLTLSARSLAGEATAPVTVDIYGILCPDSTLPQCTRSR